MEIYNKFELEDKIKFSTLAPSLQALFKKYQNDINGLKNYIAQLHPIDDIRIDEFLKDNHWMNGQVIKVHPALKTIFADNDFRNIKVVENDYELNEELHKYKPIVLEDVFKTWQRYTHFDRDAIKDKLDHTNWQGGINGQNRWDDPLQRMYLDPNGKGWVYIKKTKQIYSGFDSEPCAGFINPEDFYTNYFLRTKVDVGWDDDNLMIICGFCTDSNGIQHTLSVVRGAGHFTGIGFNPVYNPERWSMYNGSIDTTFWYGLIYDMGNPTQDFLVNLSGDIGPSKFNTNYASASDCHCIAYLTCIRRDSQLEVRTTDWSKDGSDKMDMEEFTFKWSLPDTKPYDMPQEEYDNIKTMLYYTNRVGFGVRSGQPWFSIDRQYEIFDDGDIYALHKNEVYSYDEVSGQYYVSGKVSDVLPDRIFLNSEHFKKFYFYKEPGSWKSIKMVFSEKM